MAKVIFSVFLNSYVLIVNAVPPVSVPSSVLSLPSRVNAVQPVSLPISVLSLPPNTFFSPPPKSVRTRNFAYERLVPKSKVKKQRKENMHVYIREGLQCTPETKIVVMTGEEYIEDKDIGYSRRPQEATLYASCLIHMNHSFSDREYLVFRSNNIEINYKVKPLEQMKAALSIEMPVVKTTRCAQDSLCERCAVVDVNLLDKLELMQPHIQKGLRLFTAMDINNLVLKLKEGAGRTFDGFVVDCPTLLYRHSVDGIKFGTKLCQVKWSRGCLNNQFEQVSRRNEILVGLYQGSESTTLLSQHFGNCRMTSCYGTPDKIEHSLHLQGKSLNIYTSVHVRFKTNHFRSSRWRCYTATKCSAEWNDSQQPTIQ